MKLRFLGGPLDGQDVEIGQSLLDMIDVYEPLDGGAAEPFTLISPNNGLWTYTRASLVGGDTVYVGSKQPSGPGTTLEAQSWTRVNSAFEVYNPTDTDVEVVASQTAVVLPNDFRVRVL